jgi:hypothetical protein
MQFLRTKRIDEISKQCLLDCNRLWDDTYGFALLAKGPDIFILRTIVAEGGGS